MTEFCPKHLRETHSWSTSQDLLYNPRSHSAYFDWAQFKVQNDGMAYQRTFETARLSISLKAS